MDRLYKHELLDRVIIDSIEKECRESAKNIIKKHLSKIEPIKSEVKQKISFEMYDLMAKKIVDSDPDLRAMRYRVMNDKKVIKSMAKKAFRECFDEILEETVVDVTSDNKENCKTKKMLISEKIINGILSDTLDPVTLKGVEFVRDTICEKPIDRIIREGIENKIIDINITQEKVDKVKNILDTLKKTTMEKINGSWESNPSRRIVERSGNEGDSASDLLSQFQRVHIPDVLPDKQD